MGQVQQTGFRDRLWEPLAGCLKGFRGNQSCRWGSRRRPSGQQTSGHTHLQKHVSFSGLILFTIYFASLFLATCHAAYGDLSSLDQGLNLHPRHWEPRVLTGWPPGKSQADCILKRPGLCCTDFLLILRTTLKSETRVWGLLLAALSMLWYWWGKLIFSKKQVH